MHLYTVWGIEFVVTIGKFLVLTAMNMEVTLFWVVTPYRDVTSQRTVVFIFSLLLSNISL
jgi:hypothetical protein